MLFQAVRDVRVGRGARCRACVDDDVHRRQLVLVRTERFPNQALHAVAANSIAHRFRSNRQSQACDRSGVESHDEREEGIRLTTPVLIYAIEIGFTAQPLRGCEAQSGGGRTRRGSDAQTASRLRPFARRRDSTSRPPLVAMRARKPCVRLRCRLLGWYVRFMGNPRGESPQADEKQGQKGCKERGVRVRSDLGSVKQTARVSRDVRHKLSVVFVAENAAFGLWITLSVAV